MKGVSKSILKKNKISSNAVLIYLITLLIITFFNSFYKNDNINSLLTNGSYLLNIISSLYIIARVNRSKKTIYVGVVLIIFFVIDYFFFHQTFTFVSRVFFLIFSLIALFFSFKLSQTKMPQQILSKDILYSAIAGYLWIGIFGFIMLEKVYDIDSSSLISSSLLSLSDFDLKYYSFVTLTSLGYGDITPVSIQAKSISVFIALVGQLYLTIVMAIIVSDFISKKRTR